MSQADVVHALAEFARRWRDPQDPWRRKAEQIPEPFPFAMTWVSLEALLESLTLPALWALIDAEGVRDAQGPPLIGHVIAGNTPLLAWTSLLRALLMRSGSRVKLPSGDAAQWGRLFQDSLAAISPPLAASMELRQWPGGTVAEEQAFCRDLDLALVYGSNQTIAAWRALCGQKTKFIGYGHRVSFGLIREDANWNQAAQGVARDVLLFDQGGCLSPQTIFVEGNGERACAFGLALADALAEAVHEWPAPSRSPQAAARVREVRTLARMEGASKIWEDPACRWTVICREEKQFAPSPTHGVIAVQPLCSMSELANALQPVQGSLQGCAVAGSEPPELRDSALGLSWICAPGRLQAPSLAWPQDGIPPLRSLFPEFAGGNAASA